MWVRSLRGARASTSRNGSTSFGLDAAREIGADDERGREATPSVDACPHSEGRPFWGAISGCVGTPQFLRSYGQARTAHGASRKPASSAADAARPAPGWSGQQAAAAASAAATSSAGGDDETDDDMQPPPDGQSPPAPRSA